MNYRKTCPHCGAVTVAYTINFHGGLASAFVAFAEARIRLGRPVLKRDLELDHSQYGNFQKLRHFDLIEKRAGSEWEMTPTGWGFLGGLFTVQTPAGQFGNATLPDDHEAWATHDFPRTSVTLAGVVPKEWQTRAEFAAQKAGAA